MTDDATTSAAATELHVDRDPATGEYHVSLDNAPLLDVALHDRPGDVIEARVAVRDRNELTGYCWDEVVAVTEPGDDVARVDGERVTVDPLPFGGWALQADGYDVAIVERLAGRDDRVRVAIYDRTAGSDFLAFDRGVQHHAAARPGLVADRLRAFAAPSGHAVAR